MGHVEGAGRPNLRTIPDYLNYAPSRTANFRLPGGSFGDTLNFSLQYIRNHRNGIMLDSTGQIANICKHAVAHHIDPMIALRSIASEIEGYERANCYHLQTLDNIKDALALMPDRY